jgi:magnesium-transporting ATPase (P-type)
MASNMVRWGGLAGVFAAVMFVLSFIINQLAPVQRTYDSSSDYLHQVVVLMAYVGVLVAILGLHTLQSPSRRYGRLGAVGSLLTFIGYATVFVVTAISTVQGGQALFTIRLTGGVAILIGSILLGAMIIRARVVPWWCGVLLIVAFPLGDFSNAVVRGGEAILLGLLWGSVGYALLRSSLHTPRSSSASPQATPTSE